MRAPIEIRRLKRADLAAVNALYNHYVLKTHFTFDVEALSLEKRQDWFNGFTAQGPYQCFVAVEGGAIQGYACSGLLKPKAAYATSVETSVYLAKGVHRRGLGRQLYEALFAALEKTPVHRAYAIIALPNPTSERFHTHMGFVQAGHYHEVGRKFGRYWDVKWYEKTLSAELRHMAR